MSKYTTEVRFICENAAGEIESGGYAKIADIIEKARTKIFDFDYPIFDENYRSVLETKILKHYYTREIGEETVGLWKLRLDTKLNEIMVYYNQMYESTLIDFDPLIDTNYTTQHSGSNSGQKDDTGSATSNATDNNTITKNGQVDTTGSATTNSTSNGTTSNNDDNWNYYSDTPQGDINGLVDNSYLTNATHTTSDGSGTSSDTTNATTSTTGQTVTADTETAAKTAAKTDSNTLNSVFSNTDSYLDHVTGKRGSASYSELMQEFRKTFLNIDVMVIDELKDLFINLW